MYLVYILRLLTFSVKEKTIRKSVVSTSKNVIVDDGEPHENNPNAMNVCIFKTFVYIIMNLIKLNKKQ